jgi:hypothetical protein
VLPGPVVASLPIQQKFTAIWRKLAATSNFSEIPHVLVISYRFTDFVRFTVIWQH